MPREADNLRDVIDPKETGRLRHLVKCICDRVEYGGAGELTWQLADEESEYEFDGVPFKQPTGYRTLTVRYLDPEFGSPPGDPSCESGTAPSRCGP